LSDLSLRRCPNCKIAIARTSDALMVVCPNCQNNFCYGCRFPFGIDPPYHVYSQHFCICAPHPNFEHGIFNLDTLNISLGNCTQCGNEGLYMSDEEIDAKEKSVRDAIRAAYGFGPEV